MELIRDKNQLVNAFLRKQEYDPSKTYVKNKYLYEKRIGDSLVIANGITREEILLDKNEKLTDNQYFIENWYYIDSDVDQYSLLEETEQYYRNKMTPEKYLITGATIYTTIACNARCPYCYERDYDKSQVMTEEMAIKVAKWIIAQKSQNFRLHWFGGEPLCNHKVISVICDYLKKNSSINFRSDVTSNGYLFDAIPIDTMKNLWNLKNVQITLDGIGEEYNKIKRFVYKDPDPFSKVINNINMLIENGIHVVVRLNLTENNYESLDKVITYLDENIKDRECFSIYPHAVFIEDYRDFDSEKYDKIYKNELKLMQHIKDESDLLLSEQIPGWTEPRISHCMADNKDYVTINSKGEIGGCEHYPSSLLLGTIDTNPNNYNIDSIKALAEQVPRTDKCKTCKIRPYCYYIKCCQGDEWCNDAYIGMFLWMIEKQMQSDYNHRKQIYKIEPGHCSGDFSMPKWQVFLPESIVKEEDK